MRHRTEPHRRIQAAAGWRDRYGRTQACKLPCAAARATTVRSDRWARSRLGLLRRGRTRAGCALRRRCGDRPRLHSLHVRYDRKAKGCGARRGRSHGRARVVHAAHLRHEAGRGVLGGIRCRLGRWSLLHRLRTVAARVHDDRFRGQAGRHAGCGHVLAGDERAWGRGVLYRANRVSRHSEGRPARRAHRALRSFQATCDLSCR